MTWRVVKSLLVLRDQINAAHPNRAKGADGTIGDAAHQAESASDHDPHTYTALGSTPVVCALDITHDPGHGCDSYALAETVRASHDPRIAYIISNRRIASNHAVGSTPAWAWRTYTGTKDPHTNHAHFSTVHDGRADQTQPWAIGGAPNPPGDDMASGDVADFAASHVPVPGTSSVQGLHIAVGSLLVAAQQTVALLGTVAKAQGVAQADLDDIQARVGGITLTDDQVKLLAKELNLTPDVLTAAARKAIAGALDDNPAT